VNASSSRAYAFDSLHTKSAARHQINDEIGRFLFIAVVFSDTQLSQGHPGGAELNVFSNSGSCLWTHHRHRRRRRAAGFFAYSCLFCTVAFGAMQAKLETMGLRCGYVIRKMMTSQLVATASPLTQNRRNSRISICLTPLIITNFV